MSRRSGELMQKCKSYQQRNNNCLKYNKCVYDECVMHNVSLRPLLPRYETKGN